MCLFCTLTFTSELIKHIDNDVTDALSQEHLYAVIEQVE